ncbi:MAG: hypothetical protein U5R06_24415 [candidate division KSB1 bacterium]|nr:hypothetical protein [candidate division KSB1 bacterium]
MIHLHTEISLIRRLVDFFITDVIETSAKRISDDQGSHEINRQLIWFSRKVDPLQDDLDQFIAQQIIAKASEQRSDERAEEQIRKLFSIFYQYPNLLPLYRLEHAADTQMIQQIYQADLSNKQNLIRTLQCSIRFARSVCDYVAGMTDQYAENIVQKLNTCSTSRLVRINGNELGAEI